MKTHQLKTDPDVFDAVSSGNKTFEIRFNDRDFQVGDMLILRRTKHSGLEMKNGEPLEYTGGVQVRSVSHVLEGPVYGLQTGWVILSFNPWKTNSITILRAALNQIYADTEGYSDGAKDATDHDRLCNEVSSIARHALDATKDRCKHGVKVTSVCFDCDDHTIPVPDILQGLTQNVVDKARSFESATRTPGMSICGREQYRDALFKALEALDTAKESTPS